MDSTFDAATAEITDLAQEIEIVENFELVEVAPEAEEVVVGPFCRVNIIDRHEIERLNDELEDVQRWFQEYGQNGVLFPNSIINCFAPKEYLQAA